MSFFMKDVMTKIPKTVSGETEIWKVGEIMSNLGIRHVPVCDGPKYGLLTIHDINLIKAFQSSRDFLARDYFSEKFVRVKTEDFLKDTVVKLKDEKLDCAFVFNQEDQLVGIFTMSDALRVLEKVL